MLKYAALALMGTLGTSIHQNSRAPDSFTQRTPGDTIEADVYEGWKQYSLLCSRCHGEEAQGSSIAPSLLQSLKADGPVPGKEEFVAILINGRPDKGMPPGKTLGLDPTYHDGLYKYLKGRSEGAIHPGRPVKRGT